MDFETALQNANSFSDYFKNILNRQSDLKSFLKEYWESPFDFGLFQKNDFQNDNEIEVYLRKMRQKVLSHLMLRDLNGLCDLNEVFETMTLFAEKALSLSLNYMENKLSLRYGFPYNYKKDTPQNFVIIGMGKLGARELNVSSDIDLIFLYPEEGETNGLKKIENFEYFTKLGKGIIQLLNNITEEGQVFRVDMRLRPNGDSGALVMSFLSLEHYFMKEGREWERYAWIKSRVLNILPEKYKKELEGIIQPFVFRKYLDYGAINAMRDLHAQIRQEVLKKEREDDIKLGRGGIREIEFIAQVFQLIRGGRYIELQTKSTLKLFPLLKKHHFLEGKDIEDLTSIYIFLREVEHRLQYKNDAQTHRLPICPNEQELLAKNLNFKNYEAFLNTLNHHRRTVEEHFNAIFKPQQETTEPLLSLWQEPEENILAWHDLGFHNPQKLTQQIQEIKNSKKIKGLTENICKRLEAIVPIFIEKARHLPNPDQALWRSLLFLENITQRGAYLALLQEYPHAIARVVKLLGASGWAADYLNHYPLLLDELLTPQRFEETPGSIQQTLQEGLCNAQGDEGREMDILRETHHAELFRILIKDLEGLYSVEAVSDRLSELADILLASTLNWVWQKIKQRHVESPAFAIISYGKLGGKELGYASDLDLVYLFDDDSPQAFENYAKLAQRLNTWLCSRTDAGALFQIDLRLRPNGESGLIVLPFSAFEKYQNEMAWLWEHQALTRARFCAGDENLGKRFENLRTVILQKPREEAFLRTEILKMRQKMREHKTHPHPDLFDLKHDCGGIVDVEFIVQYLVLLHAQHHAQLTKNAGNIALLKTLGALNIIEKRNAEAAGNAYREYRRLQHFLRLNEETHNLVPLSPDLRAHRESVQTLFQQVFKIPR